MRALLKEPLSEEEEGTKLHNELQQMLLFFFSSFRFFLKKRFSEKLALNLQVTDFASFKPGGAGSGSHAPSVFGIPGYTTAGNLRRKAIKCSLNCRHRLKCSFWWTFYHLLIFPRPAWWWIFIYFSLQQSQF